MKRLHIISLSLCISIMSLSAQNQGEVAPDFKYKDLDGKEVALSDHKGKVVFLFTFGYNCFNCRNAAPIIKNKVLSNYNAEPNVVRLALDIWDGSNSQVQDFINRTGLDMNFLTMGSSLRNSWNTSYDRLFVIDAQGILVYKGGGDGAAQQVNQASSAIDAALKNVSSGVSAVKSDPFKAKVYPNPVSDFASVKFASDDAGLAQFAILDLSGKTVKNIGSMELTGGVEQKDFAVNELGSGIYFLNIQTRSKSGYYRFVVQ